MNPSDADSASFPVRAKGGVSMRLVMLAYLGAMACGCVLGFYGAVLLRLDFLVGAVAAGATAWLSRSVLRERLGAHITFEMDLDGDDISTLENESSPNGNGRVSGLVSLLQTWEVLEKERGSECFDPWAVQSLRNDIRNAIRDDPELAQLFCTRR